MNKDHALFLWFMGAVMMLLAILVFISGWQIAHSVVATECQKLNAFYVNDKVYDCVVRK